VTASRTLGVVGTLVWDRIIGRYGEAGPVEEWGGIAYALSALAASLPEGWSVLPILKIGADMADEARRLLGGVPRLDDSALVVVPEANNRVELRYESHSRRCERLTGGVPPWRWGEVAPFVARCDALYVNFISGYEMGLDTAAELRSGFAGPTYADLHSLFLGKDEHGHRIPRTLESWASWLRCFDAVQMNEDEFELLGGVVDPWERAEGALGRDLGLITVTHSASGASYAVLPGLDPNPMSWRGRSAHAHAGRAVAGSVKLTGPPAVGDPTGCGDVWGATMFARLLRGDRLEAAMAEANRLAGLNVGHRGARGLVEHLTGSETRVEGAS
jgi:hypothetical protein